MKLLISFLFVAFSNTSISQEFKKWVDGYTNESYVRYYDLNTQLIIQKKTAGEKSEYQLGLIVFRTSVSSDDFMTTGAQVVFEDKSTLSFGDAVSINYQHSGDVYVQKVTLPKQTRLNAIEKFIPDYSKLNLEMSDTIVMYGYPGAQLWDAKGNVVSGPLQVQSLSYPTTSTLTPLFSTIN